jgi:23S rRNA pseudouridine2605 synthase
VSERLHKLLAQAGYGSRREIERWIAAGRVRLNDRIVQPGAAAAPGDRVTLDGRSVDLAAAGRVPCRVLAYKKHVDQIVTRHDPGGRPTVFQGLPRLKRGRWLAVGRLDVNTSGLLLLTTDGEIKRRLEHPSYALEREYAVRVHGGVDEAMIDRLLTGVELDDGEARFQRIAAETGAGGSNRWFHVVVTQGRNRVVRRLWASQGVTVSRLIRVRYGPVVLPTGVKAGRWRELDKAEVRELAAQINLKR